jgi:hypothetical protein
MRTRDPRAGIVLVFAAACVLGYRGEAQLDLRHELDGIVAVRIDLPSTPLEIVGCDAAAPAACAEVLALAGRVHATGGTAKDARAHAEKLTLVLESVDGLLSLRADVPLAVRGLVELEIDRIELPGDRDVDVRTGLGDVSVVGMRGAVAIDVDTGNVDVEDGDGGVAVRLGIGDIDARTRGDLDLVVETGDVAIVQTGDARDVHVTTDAGDVTLELADDADLDLDVRADGTIRVTTGTVVAIAEGELVRVVGEGSTQIVVVAAGDVTITRRAPP